MLFSTFYLALVRTCYMKVFDRILYWSVKVVPKLTLLSVKYSAFFLFVPRVFFLPLNCCMCSRNISTIFPSSILFRILSTTQWRFTRNLCSFQAGIYLSKGNIRDNRRMCEISSKLTIKTPEWSQWRLSGVFIVNFEQISHILLVFL